MAVVLTLPLLGIGPAPPDDTQRKEALFKVGDEFLAKARSLLPAEKQVRYYEYSTEAVKIGRLAVEWAFDAAHHTIHYHSTYDEARVDGVRVRAEVDATFGDDFSLKRSVITERQIPREGRAVVRRFETFRDRDSMVFKRRSATENKESRVEIRDGRTSMVSETMVEAIAKSGILDMGVVDISVPERRIVPFQVHRSRRSTGDVIQFFEKNPSVPKTSFVLQANGEVGRIYELYGRFRGARVEKVRFDEVDQLIEEAIKTILNEDDDEDE